MHTFIMVWSLVALLSGSPPARVDRDEYRNGARRNLREYGVATEAASLVKAITDDTRPIVRIIAADLLASLQEKRAIPVMRSALETEPEERVRIHFGEDLLKLEGASARALVHTIFSQTKALNNRIDLAGALADLGDFVGYPDVLQGLDSKDTLIVGSSEFALGRFMAECHRQCSLVPSPTDVGLQLLKNPTGVRLSAVIALSHRLDDPRVVAALELVAA